MWVSSDIPLRSLIVCFPRETAEVTGTEPGTGYNVKMAREVEEVNTGLWLVNSDLNTGLWLVNISSGQALVETAAVGAQWRWQWLDLSLCVIMHYVIMCDRWYVEYTYLKVCLNNKLLDLQSIGSRPDLQRWARQIQWSGLGPSHWHPTVLLGYQLS